MKRFSLLVGTWVCGTGSLPAVATRKTFPSLVVRLGLGQSRLLWVSALHVILVEIWGPSSIPWEARATTNGEMIF